MLGLAYPLLTTGVAQVAVPRPRRRLARSSSDGRVVGSSLLAQPFVIDTGRKDADGNAITRPNPRYFQPRPSQSDYSASATFFSNRGPNDAAGRDFYRES